LYISGRRRYHTEIFSNSSSERARAERQAINTVCQGTAADIVKCAMLQIDQYFKSIGSQARLLINIHDELLFEIPLQELEETQKNIRRIMESCVKLDVPLPVKIRVGASWGSLVEYENYMAPTRLTFDSPVKAPNSR
jgi:DNA polymerase-1